MHFPGAGTAAPLPVAVPAPLALSVLPKATFPTAKLALLPALPVATTTALRPLLHLPGIPGRGRGLRNRRRRVGGGTFGHRRLLLERRPLRFIPGFRGLPGCTALRTFRSFLDLGGGRSSLRKLPGSRRATFAFSFMPGRRLIADIPGAAILRNDSGRFLMARLGLPARFVRLALPLFARARSHGARPPGLPAPGVGCARGGR